MRDRLFQTSFMLTFALLFVSSRSEAQCKGGQKGPKGQQQTGFGQPGGMRFPQMMRQLPTQLGGPTIPQQLQQPLLTGFPQQAGRFLTGLRQPNATMAAPQPLQQQGSPMLTALQQQRQQNNFLMAVRKKQENTLQSFQTGSLNGFSTRSEQQEFQGALDTAVERTQTLIGALQQSGLTNQNPWVAAMQRQLDALTAVSEKLSR
jgi:hypothetical protein